MYNKTDKTECNFYVRKVLGYVQGSEIYPNSLNEFQLLCNYLRKKRRMKLVISIIADDSLVW